MPLYHFDLYASGLRQALTPGSSTCWAGGVCMIEWGEQFSRHRRAARRDPHTHGRGRGWSWASRRGSWSSSPATCAPRTSLTTCAGLPRKRERHRDARGAYIILAGHSTDALCCAVAEGCRAQHGRGRARAGLWRPHVSQAGKRAAGERGAGGAGRAGLSMATWMPCWWVAALAVHWRAHRYCHGKGPGLRAGRDAARHLHAGCDGLARLGRGHPRHAGRGGRRVRGEVYPASTCWTDRRARTCHGERVQGGRRRGQWRGARTPRGCGSRATACASTATFERPGLDACCRRNCGSPAARLLLAAASPG